MLGTNFLFHTLTEIIPVFYAESRLHGLITIQPVVNHRPTWKGKKQLNGKPNLDSEPLPFSVSPFPSPIAIASL